MKALICDKCGAVMKDSPDTVTEVALSTQRHRNYNVRHLCESCTEKLEFFFKAGADDQW